MPRYALGIEYDGTPYQGWQRQTNGPSVQAALELAIADLAGGETRLTAAGRTDSGVHALGQVAHVDLPKAYADHAVRNAINARLRQEAIAILWAKRVDDWFNARFDARWRRYRYRMLTRAAPPAIERDRVWHVPRALDVAAMTAAAQPLHGHHDFSSFRAAECQAVTPMKTLDVLRVQRVGDEVHIEAKARSFLHHQVRNMVGTLKLVGEGRWQADDVAAALQAKDRAAAGPTAPACGLYFVEVGYDAPLAPG
ncbi:MAG: tRNA pseudouridine(38-40) synthase TruA [Geminicoccaceae bacterium]